MAGSEPTRIQPHPRPLRVYADTSVFGGCFDPEFAQPSRQFFDEVRSGRFYLILSETTLLELHRAPNEVRSLLETLDPARVLAVEMTDEVIRLRDAYLDAGVVGPASLLDAEHIAAASVEEADLIVSWNFRHIVHFEKIRGYHAVNLLHGYRAIPIHSPFEVIGP